MSLEIRRNIKRKFINPRKDVNFWYEWKDEQREHSLDLVNTFDDYEKYENAFDRRVIRFEGRAKRNKISRTFKAYGYTDARPYQI